MNHKKDKSPIDLEYIQKLISEVEEIRAENEKLKDKVGDLSIKNDILKDSLEIVQKKSSLKSTATAK
jgi:regulator of replication initiation timing